MKMCPVSSCDRPAQSLGWCQKHYYRWKTYGDPLITLYNMDGEHIACSVEGCQTAVVHTARRPNRPEWGRKPLCPKHYYRAKRGEPLVRDRERGDGTYKEGYVYFVRRDHPAARKSGYIAEHRLVMESLLGRYLLPEETVHHKNGIRDDNRPENLELWNSSHPPGQRATDKLAWARRIVALYETHAPDLG
jgi:HNH endonuclease